MELTKGLLLDKVYPVNKEKIYLPQKLIANNLWVEGLLKKKNLSKKKPIITQQLNGVIFLVVYRTF